MRIHKLSILVVQETYLDKEQTQELNGSLRNITVYNSTDPNQPNSKGIAFAVNKSILNWEGTKVNKIISERAILMTTP